MKNDINSFSGWINLLFQAMSLYSLTFSESIVKLTNNSSRRAACRNHHIFCQIVHMYQKRCGIIRLLSRAVLYLLTLFLLYLLARNGLSLITASGVPFGFSSRIEFLFSILYISFYIFLGALIIYHFFNREDHE